MPNGCVHVTNENNAGATTSHLATEELKIMYGGAGDEDIMESVDSETAVNDACSKGQFCKLSWDASTIQ